MAKKTKTTYACQSCGYQSVKWMGRCLSCGEWNSFVEEKTADEPATPHGQWRGTSQGKGIPLAVPQPIGEVVFSEADRLPTNDQELNRVLGGGIMPGAVVLIGGEPGIGKSTLMLQIALNLASQNIRVLYVSGEESNQQVRLRAERIGLPQGHANCYLLAETNTQNIFGQIEALPPGLLIVDSIQTLNSSMLESAPGSVSQVRECAAELIRFAKETHTPVFLIGHITKEGSLAGPKVLEHMVDTVLQFEGDRHLSYRILRTVKNRYGSTSELGIYEMRPFGLRQVSNPSEILISQREGDLSGVAIGAMVEGNRPLLVEIQSLVSPTAYGTAQRSSTGFDAKRLNMLLAVLEKRCGYKLSFQDVFLNVTGGLKVEDPALDLAVCTSIVSSLQDLPVGGGSCFAAEVGLGGEIRAVHRTEQRIAEAEKLGFKEIYVSRFSFKDYKPGKSGIRVHLVSKIEQVFEALAG